MLDKLLIIAGPTGVGKTNLSIELAKKLNGEIISADSMQIYKYMDIGSAKILEDEKQGIKHHLIDVCEPSESFSVSVYVDLAKRAISEIISKGKTPIVVGGTGLYIRSLIYDCKHCNLNEDENYRKVLYDLALEKGNRYLHNMLREIDIQSYDSIHFNNVKRVVRALEVYKLTGKPFSSFKSDITPVYDFKYYVLNINREILYNQINQRVDKMIENGLIQEVQYLKQKGYDETMQSMQGIGYKEIFEYLNGKVTLDEAIEKIKKGSRNYAKRQLTWFNKELNHEMIYKDNLNDFQILDYIVQEF